jgi:predicted acylesterase/phospholipase RssA
MEKIDLSPIENKKIALVLSGGVVKAGSWHLGVALALQELGFSFKNNKGISPENHLHVPLQNKLEISTYVGTSAGAMVSLLLASGIPPEIVIHSSLNTIKTSFKNISYKDMIAIKSPLKRPAHKRTLSPFKDFPWPIRQLLRPLTSFSGIFSTTGMANYLKNHVLEVERFEDLKSDVFIIATQLDHSRKVIFSKYNYPSPRHNLTASYYTGIPIVDAAAASMSVPPLYSPYPILNPVTNQIDYYIDGDIRETLSTHAAVDNNCECIISSWTHTPYHYHDEIGSLINYGLPAICVQTIYLAIQRKILMSRNRRIMAKDVIDTVNNYMDSHGFSKVHRQNITSIIEQKLSYSPKLKLIDIYPKHEDFKIFFASFFSLQPENSALTVKLGYKRTMEVFKELEFE